LDRQHVPFFPRRKISRCAVHLTDGRIGKGLGVKPCRLLSVAIVPKANRVLCWCVHVSILHRDETRVLHSARSATFQALRGSFITERVPDARDPRPARNPDDKSPANWRSLPLLRSVLSTRFVVCEYVASAVGVCVSLTPLLVWQIESCIRQLYHQPVLRQD